MPPVKFFEQKLDRMRSLRNLQDLYIVTLGCHVEDQVLLGLGTTIDVSGLRAGDSAKSSLGAWLFNMSTTVRFRFA
ncbi:unnamed protein product [Phytophthora fragariaefolia]|uniref:Unnamed protein product n=1 Tax=Phytophthora fragariaefolia TaxID=1490495 RepID=A0A9W6XMR9_9STRA|nr:unnamed protein product [Phytophthora fragariaefolia]